MYLRFKDEDGAEWGSFEVFHRSVSENVADGWLDDAGEPLGEGWYWWACFPGCMPDGDPFGPYETEDEAITAANDE